MASVSENEHMRRARDDDESLQSLDSEPESDESSPTLPPELQSPRSDALVVDIACDNIDSDTNAPIESVIEGRATSLGLGDTREPISQLGIQSDAGKEGPQPRSARRVDLPSIQDWRSMDYWAQPMIDLSFDRREALGEMKRRPTMLCVCAGTAAEIMASLALDLRIGRVWFVDLKEASREFCYNNYKDLVTIECMWTSIEQAECSCACALHKGEKDKCVLPARVDISVMCGPCQPFTTMRAGRGPNNPRNHKSFGTIFGENGSILSINQHVLCDYLLSENVVQFMKELPGEEISPYSLFVKRLMEVQNEAGKPHFTGFSCLRLENATFINVNRSRCFMLAVSGYVGGSEASSSIEGRVEDILKRYPVICPEAPKMLETLLDEVGMQEREEHQKPFKKSNIVKADSEWRAQAARVRYLQCMTPDEMPWVSTHKLHGVPPSERYKESIALAYKAYELKYGATDAPKWFVDLKEAVGRRPWSQCCPCLGQTSLPYMFYFDRVMDAQDRFRVHGFPRCVLLHSIAKTNLYSLAGESMSLPCVGVLMQEIMLWEGNSWWDRSRVERMKQLKEAMAMEDAKDKMFAQLQQKKGLQDHLSVAAHSTGSVARKRRRIVV